MKNTLRTSILFGALVIGGLGACSPAVPENPTWQADIRPLMVARCIRCHDGAGHNDPDTDAATQKASGLLVNFNFNVGTVQELSLAAAGILKAAGPQIVRGPYAGFTIMPPPPAEKLEDWEIQLLDNWWRKPELK